MSDSSVVQVLSQIVKPNLGVVLGTGVYCNCILPEPSHVILFFCLHFLVWGTFVSAFPGVVKEHASKT